MPRHAGYDPSRTKSRPHAARRLSLQLALVLLIPAAHAQPPARAQDSKNRAAEKAAAEASKLRAGWAKDSLRAAADKFMQARSAWRAAGRPLDAVDALTAAAETHFTLGEYRQALRLYALAAGESRRSGDQRREHEALSSAGRTRSYLGDNDQAQKTLESVIRYYERRGYAGGPPGDKRLLAAALSNMGEVYHTKGTPLKARGHFERALALWSEAGDTRGAALARLNLGYTFFNSGELGTAAAHFERALALAREAGDRTVEALALAAAGSVRSFGGQEQAALGLHLEALEIARAVGDRQSEAVALNGLGQAYEGLGNRPVALDYYGQALRLFLGNGSLDFAAGTEYSVARVYRLTGDTGQALEHYRRCLALSRRANKRRFEAYALTDIAALYHAEGRRGETLDQYNRALDIYRRVGDRRGQAVVLQSMGDLASESGDRRKALAFYGRALPLAQASGDRETEAVTLYNAALAARDSGDLDDAIGYARQSIEIVEAVRSYATGPDLRSSYFASAHRHYGLYVDLLMRLDRLRPAGQHAAAALLASEQARARSLLELLTEGGANLSRVAEPRLLDRERDLQRMLRAKAHERMQLSSDTETEAEAAEAARQLRQMTAEYQVVQAQIRGQNPRYAALTQPQPISLGDIQAELRGENTALLEYALGDDKSYLWVVTADSLSSYELPGRAAVEAAAREVYGLLTSRQADGAGIDAEYQARVAAADEQYEEKAHALSRMLLGPAAPQLDGRRLLVVAEGVLQYIPFEALPVPDAEPGGADAEPGGGRARRAGGPDAAGRPLLISRHEIVSIPSMSALIRLRRERSRVGPAPELVAVLADPVYEADDQRVANARHLPAGGPPRAADDSAPALRAVRDLGGINGAAGIPRLRHTAGEAEAIMSLAPAGRAMLAAGFEASRETALSSRLGRYQIVHFAAHGLVNSEHPELSGIILSLVNREGGPADGYLQLHDIYGLDLRAELVVLSACNTGLGKDVKGEGIVGLTRVFLHAGSQGVVASLWKVDDAATAELMRHFYKAMLEDGLPPAAALRSAKEAMRRQKRWRAPYYWAGFVMQGEYRQRIRADYGRPAAGLVVALAAVFFGGVAFYVRSRLRGRRAVGGGVAAAPFPKP